MKTFKNLLAFFLVLFVFCSLISCSGKDINSAGPHEFSGGPVVDSDEPLDNLVKRANDYYDDGNYRSAIKIFDNIYKREPYGRFALYSKTKIADAYFKSGMYPEATNSYYELVKSQTGNYNKEYAIFMTGLSNYRSFKGVGRDNSAINKAIEFFDTILEQYPNSKYTLDAKKYKLECYRLLALREQEILKYYEKREDEVAFRKRQLDFDRNWKKYL